MAVREKEERTMMKFSVLEPEFQKRTVGSIQLGEWFILPANEHNHELYVKVRSENRTDDGVECLVFPRTEKICFLPHVEVHLVDVEVIARKKV